MKKRKISVSFSKNYQDVYEFLIKKPNISQFICEVIKERMLEEQNNSLEKQVEQILDKLIAERGLSIANISSGTLNSASLGTIGKLKNEDKDLIDSLF